MFPPAAVLAGVLTTAAATSATSTSSLGAAVSYLCFPWLAGHAWLYGCACATAEIRGRLRVVLTARDLHALGSDATDEALRRMFARFDTSGDGALDADELKIALRSALGAELSRSDCERLVGLADKDGTQTVDFEEFKAICRGAI